MPFVPMVPPQRPASARAQDLGRRLKAEVEKFEAQYPGTSREDLRAAAALAIGEESVSVPRQRRVAGVLIGMVAALVALGLSVRTEAQGGSSPWPIVAVMVAVMAAGLVSVIVGRSRR